MIDILICACLNYFDLILCPCQHFSLSLVLIVYVKEFKMRNFVLKL